MSRLGDPGARGRGQVAKSSAELRCRDYSGSAHACNCAHIAKSSAGLRRRDGAKSSAGLRRRDGDCRQEQCEAPTSRLARRCKRAARGFDVATGLPARAARGSDVATERAVDVESCDRQEQREASTSRQLDRLKQGKPCKCCRQEQREASTSRRDISLSLSRATRGSDVATAIQSIVSRRKEQREALTSRLSRAARGSDVATSPCISKSSAKLRCRDTAICDVVSRRAARGSDDATFATFWGTERVARGSDVATPWQETQRVARGSNVATQFRIASGREREQREASTSRR